MYYAGLHWGKHARGDPEDECRAQILELISKEKAQTMTIALSQYSTRMWTLGSLAYAAAFGLTRIVNHLLNEGVDVNKTNHRGFTALMSAANAGHINTVRVLLNADADVNKADKRGTTALVSAAGTGFVDTVGALLAANAAVDQASKDNKTALMTAAGKGHDEIVQLLLDHEANVEAATESGDTSLIEAARKGFTSTVQLLIDKGANIDAQKRLLNAAVRSRSTAMVELAVNKTMKADDMENPLVYSLVQLSKVGGPTAAISELLIEKGADPTGAIDGETPIHVAAHYGNVEAVRSLCKHDVSPNLRDEVGNTPIHKAAFTGAHEIIEILVAHDADLTAQNDAGESGLHTFLRSEHCGRFHHLVPLLVGHDVPLNRPDAEGKTALHLAAHRGFEPTVEFLMKHGADGSRKDHEGRTPLETAAVSGNEELVEQMLKHAATRCPPHLPRLLAGTRLRNAVEENDSVLIQEILKDPDVDVTIPNVFGWTALHFAASYGPKSIVESLLKRGALVNARKVDPSRKDPSKRSDSCKATPQDFGTTPLHVAAGHGHMDIVELLLKHGADLHATDDDGYKAFFIAAQKGYANVIKLLLGHGSEVSESLEGRATPLQASVDFSHKGVVRLLLENGADAERDTDWGKKMLEAAKYQKREKRWERGRYRKLPTSRQRAGIVKLLESHGFTTAEE